MIDPWGRIYFQAINMQQFWRKNTDMVCKYLNSPDLLAQKKKLLIYSSSAPSFLNTKYLTYRQRTNNILHILPE